MAQAQRNLEAHIQELNDIIGVARTVVSTLDLDKVLDAVLHNAMQFMNMPAGMLEVYNETTGEMIPHVHSGLSPEFVANDRWRISARTDLVTKRAMHDGRIHHIAAIAPGTDGADALLKENIRSLVCVPLLLQGRPLGVLYLYDFQPRELEQRQLDLLGIFASFAVMSIDNASLHTRTKRMAITDALTGIYNNRYFKQVFPYELSRARRYGKPLSLIMMDIDHFKQLNDTYGHPKGDQVLATLGKVLSGSLRAADFSFRYGGEEFAVLLPETRIEGAFLVAESLREKIRKSVSPVLGEAVDQQVTVSLGVACYPNDANTPELLLKHADSCLYKAKKQGRNRVYWESCLT
ncbi:sensor domain-containing diguanylate cyclase [Geobacter sp. DSM 9736]|uniref:GGDEF domain-containing protein n=1 Tax=Geobacter sp. DSM 9736 TaxID=1277350 RepID=UPI000B50B8D4|nr:sensor domain-containing diguanylate cyclase [Geobacter sp. DSM 9736]SNB46798.1 diguanylate cyclase (GGDEF) domain-containing protein [Geobacter sp. DSM 9736]